MQGPKVISDIDGFAEVLRAGTPTEEPETAPFEPPIEQVLEEVGGGLLPRRDPWIPLAEIVAVIHHPNFYWGAIHNTDLKYLSLRLDTRDNCATVCDRHGKPVDMAKVWAALENPTVPGMNQNPRLALLPISDEPSPTAPKETPTQPGQVVFASGTEVV